MDGDISVVSYWEKPSPLPDGPPRWRLFCWNENQPAGMRSALERPCRVSIASSGRRFPRRAPACAARRRPSHRLMAGRCFWLTQRRYAAAVIGCTATGPYFLGRGASVLRPKCPGALWWQLSHCPLGRAFDHENRKTPISKPAANAQRPKVQAETTRARLRRSLSCVISWDRSVITAPHCGGR